MFDEFVCESIKKHCRNLDRTIYHLDGIGELQNLDKLLSIKELDAIQWIPGSNGGRASYFEWLDVYNKILEADKLIQIAWADYADLENIVKSVEKKGYVQQSMSVFSKEQRDYAISSIEKIKSL
jgi:hypothetical protein